MENRIKYVRRPSGIQREKNRHGKTVYYFRRQHGLLDWGEEIFHRVAKGYRQGRTHTI